MRLTLLALILYVGTKAFCQSTVPVPGSPYKPQQNPPIVNWPGTDFSKLPPVWNGSFVAPRPMIVLPNLGAAHLIDRAQIDPQMIVHPPKSSLGVQPQGTLVAQNEFPGLQFLPIGSSSRKFEKIPSPWPHLKIQQIPVVWPNFKLIPVGNQAPGKTSRPAK